MRHGLSLYWNTIKYLKPVQIRHQIQNRLIRKKHVRHFNYVGGVCDIRIMIPKLDLDSAYLERFSVPDLMEGSIRLLHETHIPDKIWHVSDASHLWNYNLHYLEFTIPIAVRYQETGERLFYDEWKEIVLSWIGASSKAADAFAPYTISLRIPNLLIGMELVKDILETDVRESILQSIYDQYRYLLAHQEMALLANHYFENLKTIVIASVLFEDRKTYSTYFRKFLKETDEQILGDGVHFERSPMYHKLILEDILRVFKVLSQAGHRQDAERLMPVIKRMAIALKSLEDGFSDTPLFNDTGNNVAKPAESLLAECARLTDVMEMKTDLPESGYHRFDRGECAVLFDCGEIGPSYTCGHAHNDCLSFELAVNGKKIFTNSGTGQYQGIQRAYFRSTAAHNTLMIDEREQSELWGEHRAARRIRNCKTRRHNDTLTGQFRSFRGDAFRRRLEWKGHTLVITDDVKAADHEKHTLRQFLHVVPGLQLEIGDDCILVIDKGIRIASVFIPKGSTYVIHKEGSITCFARDFGETESKQVLEMKTVMKDQASTQIRLELAA